jgi:hypothetical protein
MAEIQHNARLNGFVISLGRSLLQYADECWPWIDSSEAELQTVLHRLAELQRQAVAALVELLDQREWPIDFGAYPNDYGDLHFVSLDYLLSLLVAGEQANVADLDEAVHACADDPRAVAVLREVLTTEQKILERLQSAAAARNPAAAR